MEATDQAAEQVVRITLAGGETAVRLTGAAAANVAAALTAAAASDGRTKGRARLQTMLKTGRELRVFRLPREQLEGFAREARRYGDLYAVVRGEGGGPADLIVKAEDASKTNRTRIASRSEPSRRASPRTKGRGSAKGNDLAPARPKLWTNCSGTGRRAPGTL